MSKRIFCNGMRIYFKAAEFSRGRLKREDDTMSEQCEGCGVDISESGRVKKPSTVVCDCGAEYNAIDVADPS